ncbi:MAG: hypothetical protein AAGK67_18190 [Pseudomonadota bacterium]
MSPQSILIGQIILVFTTVICGVWFATQWVAYQLVYDPYLGAPWFTICPCPLKLDHLLLSIFDGKGYGYGEEEIF